MRVARLCFLIILFSFSLEAHEFTLNQGYVENTGFMVKLPYQSKRDLPIIKVSIEGVEYSFLLDTGAPTMITKSIRKKGRFQRIRNVLSYDINDNQASLPAVRIPQLKLGTLCVRDVPAILADDDNPIFEYLQIDGIIGSNLLRNMVVRISSDEHVVSLTDDIVNLGTANAFSQPMATDKDIQSSPVLRINLGAHITEELLFDTGFDGFYKMSCEKLALFRGQDDIKIIGQVANSGVFGMFGEETQGKSEKLLISEYGVCGFSFRDVVAFTSDTRNSKLGAKLLRYGNVTLDYIHDRFYFEPYNQAESISLKELTEAYYCGN